MRPNPSIILFFDSECLLCSKSVQWLIKRDPKGLITFAPLQGETARQHLTSAYISGLNTVVLKKETEIYIRSKAILHLCKYLKSPWSWLSYLRYIPRPIADAFYKLIAKYRRHLFKGNPNTCLIGHEDRILK